MSNLRGPSLRYDALKGRWHGQTALVEGNTDYSDRAIIEFEAAIYHYKQAGHERYCAHNLNNLAMTLYKLGRYNEAHEHLDRAQLIFTRTPPEKRLRSIIKEPKV